MVLHDFAINICRILCILSHDLVHSDATTENWENQGRWTVPKKVVEKPSDGGQKSSQKIGTPYQMEDNKNPKGAARSAGPLGVAPKAPPCCLPFAEDFICFGLTSGAHPEAFPPFLWGLSTFLGSPILACELVFLIVVALSV